MVRLVQGDDTHGLLLPGFGKNRLLADTASGSELVMEVLDAVNHVPIVDCKWDTLQTFATDDAAKAVRVIRFAGRSEDAIHDRRVTYTALLQRVLRKVSSCHSVRFH